MPALMQCLEEQWEIFLGAMLRAKGEKKFRTLSMAPRRPSPTMTAGVISVEAMRSSCLAISNSEATFCSRSSIKVSEAFFSDSVALSSSTSTDNDDRKAVRSSRFFSRRSIKILVSLTSICALRAAIPPRTPRRTLAPAVFPATTTPRSEMLRLELAAKLDDAGAVRNASTRRHDANDSARIAAISDIQKVQPGKVLSAGSILSSTNLQKILRSTNLQKSQKDSWLQADYFE